MSHHGDNLQGQEQTPLSQHAEQAVPHSSSPAKAWSWEGQHRNQPSKSQGTVTWESSHKSHFLTEFKEPQYGVPGSVFVLWNRHPASQERLARLTPSLDSLGLLSLCCLQAGDAQGHLDLLTQ